MTQSQDNQPIWWEHLQKLLDNKLVGWGIPTLFFAIAAERAKNLQWREFGIFLGVAAAAWMLIRIGSKILPYFDRFLDWLLTQVIPEFWATVTDPFQGKYFKRLEYDCRDYEGRGFNAQGLRLEDVFVPLKLNPNAPDRAVQDILRNKLTDLQGQQDIGKLLASISNQKVCKHLVILGAPGSGKSTLLRHLTLMYAIRQHQRLHRKTPSLIPIFLRLRDVYPAIVNQQPLLDELITDTVKTLQPTNPLEARPSWFKRKLEQGKCLVMLDGLDEIADDQQRQQVSHWVDRQLREFKDTPFILTSRPNAYNRAPLRENAISLEVQPFTLTERNHFIQNWFDNVGKANNNSRLDAGVRDQSKRQALDLTQQVDGSPTLRSMATNPLLLTLMARTYSEKIKLPRRRAELYAEVCRVLLEGRQRYQTTSGSLLSAKRKQEILQVLALAMTQNKMLRFTLNESSTYAETFTGAKKLLREELRRVPNVPSTSTKLHEFIEAFVIQDEVGVRELLSDREQEGIYEFAHRTFQEYLTAVQLEKTGNELVLQAAFAGDEKDLAWWSEVIRFYAAQSSATGIIRAALDHPTIPSLTLAYECLQVTEDVAEPERQELTTRLEQGLQSDDPQEFKLAATVRLTSRLNQLNPDCSAGSISDISCPEIIDNSAVTGEEYNLFRLETASSFSLTPKCRDIKDYIEAAARYLAEDYSLEDKLECIKDLENKLKDLKFNFKDLQGLKNLEDQLKDLKLNSKNFQDRLKDLKLNSKDLEDRLKNLKLNFKTLKSISLPSMRGTFLINLWDANLFCAWLSQKTQQQFGVAGICYRPMTSAEQLEQTLSSTSPITNDHLRLVRFRVPEQYHRLAYYLAAGKWKDADQETYEVMLRVAGREKQRYLDIDDIRQFPCEDLQVIDRLWVQYSNGKFGFSVQKRIWLDVGGWLEGEQRRFRLAERLPRGLQRLLSRLGFKQRSSESEIWLLFFDRVGWRKEGEALSYDQLTFNPEISLLGELPFGVEVIPFDSWYGVVPFLFSRVETCKL